MSEAALVPLLTAAEIAAKKRQIAAQEAARVAWEDEAADLAVVDALASLRARADAAQSERMSLPCAQFAEEGEVSRGADVCIASGAWKGTNGKGCRFLAYPEWCSKVRDRAQLDLVTERLRAAGVGAHEARFVRHAVSGRRDANGSSLPVEKLDERDALIAVRAFLAASPVTVAIGGSEVAFTGRETLLVLAGSTGIGKSIAAAHAIGAKGGLWVNARSFEAPKFDVGPATNANFLVLDDLGTEHVGEAGYANGRIAALLADRHSSERRTLATSNLRKKSRAETDPPQFTERYGDRLADRMNESGKYIGITGASLRVKAGS